MKRCVFCKKHCHWSLVVCIVFILGLTSVLRLGPSVEYKPPPAVCPKPPLALQPLDSKRVFKQPNVLSDPCRRTDVEFLTPWLAPIVWDTTFDTALLDAIHGPRNITVATTVFAVGKYVRFLRDFLETAERHYFVGSNVRLRYYVFTDQPDKVPSVEMGVGRELLIRSVPARDRWQDISAGRMKYIQALIESELLGHADYIFCLDVDDKFHAHWGTETLGQLVAVLHPWFYTTKRESFTYERSSASTAYMAPDEGDYYYQAAVFGGELGPVHHLVSTCFHNWELDKLRGIEAVWQDESHFNRYLWLHKPSKVLSPEYLWQDARPTLPEIKIKRFSSVSKDYAEVRPNV